MSTSNHNTNKSELYEKVAGLIDKSADLLEKQANSDEGLPETPRLDLNQLRKEAGLDVT